MINPAPTSATPSGQSEQPSAFNSNWHYAIDRIQPSSPLNAHTDRQSLPVLKLHKPLFCRSKSILKWIRSFTQRINPTTQPMKARKPDPKLTSLPPFECYRRVAAGDLTPQQAGDLWRVHMADGSWDVEWIRRLNAYIESRSRPDGESELVSFARAQVEAARVAADSELVAMTLTTLGGVTMQVEQHVAEGLAFELDALEALRGMDSAVSDFYLKLVCANISRLLPAVPHYDGSEAVLPLVRRVVDVVAAAAAIRAIPMLPPRRTRLYLVRLMMPHGLALMASKSWPSRSRRFLGQNCGSATA